MKRLLFILILVFLNQLLKAQPQALAVDSMRTEYAKATTVEDKVHWLDLLSKTTMNVSLDSAEYYGKLLITTAEESRDRKLMVKAYLSNGVRSSYFSNNPEYVDRAITYFNKALVISNQNNMEDYVGAVKLKLATIHLSIPDKEKALDFVNEAFSLISTLGNDSLMIEAHLASGGVYLSANKKKLALRHFLDALQIAEQVKKTETRNALMRSSYLNLSAFYSNIEDYDRAIDYHMLATKKLDDIKEKSVPYQRAMDINSIGNLYAYKKSHDIAISYFERSVAMADSLKFSTLKVPGYISLLNQYLRMDQPKRALDYFNSTAGKALKEYLQNFGLSGVIDQAYGVIHTDIGNYDSAKYYFDRSDDYFEKNANDFNRIYYYVQRAKLLELTGQNAQAIELYEKIRVLAEKNGQLPNVELAAKHLDTLYTKTGNFQLASKYNSIYYQYKDSIRTLSEEKELAQVEAADEQQRQERLLAEKEEKDRRRNNIQYLAITIGIAALFIALVVLGMFKVSATTIKMIGFFAFIMFFEFIFLLFKKNIYSITRGEPWKDLLFMIGLAAVLLPLHHWLEKRVIIYLTSHNRLTSAGHHLRRRLFRRSNTENK
jgi:tetratricopeptide (TPR) repeat protein